MAIDDKVLSALNGHLSQWQSISARMRAQFTPVDRIQKALQKSLQPFLAEQKRWQALADSMKAPRFESDGLLRLSKQLTEFQESLQRLISPAFDQLERSFRELSPRTQEAILLLAAHGWYWDLEMHLSGLWKLKKALSEGNVEEAEQALADYFEGRLEVIEESIAEKYPHRANLIKAAFNAHRRQEYELSIPVLLAQADGMCKDVADQYLFTKKGGKPRTAAYVRQIAADTYRAALLSPLAEVLPINASECDRGSDFDALNRHTVLHGEALDYGSKTNGLKAISLVNYIAQVLQLEEGETDREGSMPSR